MDTKYSPLSNNSTRESDVFSDTETETENEMDTGRTKNISVKNLNWKSLRFPLTTSIFLSVLLVVMLGSWSILEESSGERKLPTPHLPAETIVFQNHSDFSGAPTPENNALWMDLLGPGMGFVTIQNPSKYGLPEGLKDDRTPPDVEVYGISMYHQLHCLMMVRNTYWAALRGELNLNMSDAQGEELWHSMSHVNHCFDYIRQAIMCAGDMSIEGAAAMRGENDHPRVNGYGSSHVCKSYQVSREWMDANTPP